MPSVFAVWATSFGMKAVIAVYLRADGARDAAAEESWGGSPFSSTEGRAFCRAA
jgi:hypothetical protein